MISITDIENVRDVFKIFHNNVCNNSCNECNFFNDYYKECNLKENYNTLTELLENMKEKPEEEN